VFLTEGVSAEKGRTRRKPGNERKGKENKAEERDPKTTFLSGRWGGLEADSVFYYLDGLHMIGSVSRSSGNL